MKKIYSLALMLVALLCFFSANASVLKLNVNHAEAIKTAVVHYWGDSGYVDLDLLEGIKLVDGVNEITVNATISYGELRVTAASGWLFTSAYNPWDEALTIEQAGTYVSDYTVSNYNLDRGCNTWTINASDSSAFRTATFTLDVEDASKVKSIKFDGTGYEPEFETGENQVAFSPTEETKFVITPVDNGIYQVLKNDAEVAKTGSTWTVTDLADGDNVKIVSTYPDIDVPVHITFTNPGTEGIITELTVDGEAVEPEVYLADDFTVKLASTIHFAIDRDNHSLTKFYVNGESAYADYGYTAFIGGETTFEINAIKYEQFTKRIVVEGPAEGFKLRLGQYSTTGNPIELVEGENLLTMSTKSLYLNIECGNAYNLISIMDGETDILSKLTTYTRYFQVNTTDDLVIKIEKLVFENVAYFFFEEDPLAVVSSLSLSSGTYSAGNTRSFTSDLKKGYNMIEFNNDFNPFSLYWYTSYSPANANYTGDFVYRNGEKVTSSYTRNYTFNDLADGDVIKVFFNAEAPATYNLTFEDNTEEDLTFTVHHDYVKPIEDLSATHQVLAGTHVKLTAEEGKEIAVKVGDNEPMTASEHEFFVTDHTHVVVNSPNTTGVANVAVDAAAAEGEVFNLQGIRVAPANEFNQLPAGIYIMNGAKVVKK